MAYLSSLEALADPTRRRLFDVLRRGPCSVNELVGTVKLTQPAVSQHLRVLRDARLVRVRKDGQRRIYSVDRAGLAELRAYVDSLWDDVLTAYEQAASEAAARAADPSESETKENSHD
jgi:DNA-binding transcriptional ArsR family regulator